MVEEGKCFHGKALPQGKTASHGGACCMVIALGTWKGVEGCGRAKEFGKDAAWHEIGANSLVWLRSNFEARGFTCLEAFL